MLMLRELAAPGSEVIMHTLVATGFLSLKPVFFPAVNPFIDRTVSHGRFIMRRQKDRRKPSSTPVIPFEDLCPGATDRRKIPDRRLENLNVEERQLLLSEMPGKRNTSD